MKERRTRRLEKRDFGNAAGGACAGAGASVRQPDDNRKSLVSAA